MPTFPPFISLSTTLTPLTSVQSPQDIHIRPLRPETTHTIPTDRYHNVSTVHTLFPSSGSLSPTHIRHLPSFASFPPAAAMPYKDAYDTPRGRLTRIGAWELGHTLGRGAYGMLTG